MCIYCNICLVSWFVSYIYCTCNYFLYGSCLQVPTLQSHEPQRYNITLQLNICEVKSVISYESDNTSEYIHIITCIDTPTCGIIMNTLHIL